MMDRAGAKYYYFRDGLGSIREITDNGGTVQNSYNYGAREQIRNQSQMVNNIYGYTGREFSEDGFYFYRARYLDSNLGRFISVDPASLVIFQSPDIFAPELYLYKLYLYVEGNPINLIDPLGLLRKDT